MNMMQEGVRPVNFWKKDADGERFICTVCPRACRMRPGQRGVCFVRMALEDGSGMGLTGYGRCSGLSIDPIEKKPLYHYYPGGGILSFGTMGCNLACRYCQNWHISRAKQPEVCDEIVTPQMLVAATKQTGCIGIAATYNDPVIFLEYVQDIVAAAEKSVKMVLVTAGYVSQEARPFLFQGVEAVNVDLKSMDDSFYRSLCKGEKQPVLDTLIWLKTREDIWTEVTTLIIPGHNDCVEHMRRLAGWIVEHMGPAVPLHLSAFFPHYLMKDVPATDPAVILQLREVAQQEGLLYVYGGNFRHKEAMSTYCPHCKALVIERQAHQVTGYHLDSSGKCLYCHGQLHGHFGEGIGQWAGQSPRRVHFQST